MRINRREMAFFILGGFFVIALLYYLFIISPAIARQNSLIEHIEKKEADLVGMIELKGKWERFKANKLKAEKILDQRGKKFTLLSFLEGVSRKVGIDNKIQYMKPLTFHEELGALEPVGIEMNLGGINIKQLVNLLHKIECSEKLLRVTLKKDKLLKVTLQVNTYM
ncbi:MAG: hypothetical protein JRI94_07765 [Deltaproteobacteria bacterium]|nr:hypothetical protein [Deltaproteobacteria bacterium]